MNEKKTAFIRLEKRRISFMDIIAKKAKNCHDFSVEITEKLRVLIVAEIGKTLRGETSQRVLEGLLQGNTLAEKEAH